jgi:hypothetical protein
MQQPALHSEISGGSGWTLLEKCEIPGSAHYLLRILEFNWGCQIELGTSQMELAAHTPFAPAAPPALQQTHHAADGAERRIAPRRRVLKNALIVFNSRYCTHRCFILNMSETGAQLMPQDVAECPSEFVLKPQIGKERDCEVVWRQGEFVGVRYV